MNTSNTANSIEISDDYFSFHWCVSGDEASLEGNGQNIWKGPLLPSLWYRTRKGDNAYVKAELSEDIAWENGERGRIPLCFGDVATGLIEFHLEADGLVWDRWVLEWVGEPLPIIASYIGAMELTPEVSRIVPTLEKPFWPGWHAFSLCIPSGRVGPLQSFLRRWDNGRGRIALGNFAPAMGTPYGAAFPRPILAAGFGEDAGWLVMGCPGVPDGAMSLLNQCGCSCFEFLYHEDIWGGLPGKSRLWEMPLKLVWARQAIDAYGRFYYEEQAATSDAPKQYSMWNTWGDFREGIFNLPEMAHYTRRAGCDLLVYDDLWETMNSSAEPDYERFPDFDKNIDDALKSGLKIGFWQSVGWVDHPDKVGLTKDDLLCGVHGEPRLCSWSFDPLDDGLKHYALDPSSARSREFITGRIRRLLEALPVTLLKIDFYYGLPGPEVAVPRDPMYRGERLGFALIKLIAEVAHEVRPELAILGYTLHPALSHHIDMVALDDLGDAAGREADGHGQWSFWSVLAGRGGQAVNASSGYDWAAETDVLLNTAVIGAPGGILPLNLEDGPEVTARRFRLRRALGKFFRRTKGWKPLWLNSSLGSVKSEPVLRCWGRLEMRGEGEYLAALALRDGAFEGVSLSEWPDLKWGGNWALISQQNESIFNTEELACIPLEGTILSFNRAHPPKAVTMLIETEKGDVELPCDFWKWHDGVFTLNIENKAEKDDLVACVVRQ